MGRDGLIDKVKKGGFLPIQVTLDGLQDILVDIIEMIQDQKEQIEDLKKEKADKSDIEKLDQKIDDNKEETDKKLKELEKLINDKNNELLERLNNVEKKADDALNTANETRDQFGNLNGGISSDQLKDLQDQLKELRDKIENVEQNSREKDNDLESQIQALKSQFVDHNNNNESRFNELERLIRELGDKYATKYDLDKLNSKIDSISHKSEPQVIERTTVKHEEYPVREPPPRDDSELNALKAKVEDHERRITKLEERPDVNLDDILEKIKKLQADIDSRPDRDLIERLFEKFKESMNGLVDMINANKKEDDGSNYATKKDLKKLEKMIKSITMEFEEAAAARKSTKCLSCGKGYRTIAGVIPDSEQAAILGVAPISQVCDGINKPCFVYGSDHELYYSSSPRGKTFVASSARSDNRRDKKSVTK